MKKITGHNLIELYDKYGSKIKSKKDNSGGYIFSLAIAKKWENKKAGNTAIISRILYNSIDNNDKWGQK